MLTVIFTHVRVSGKTKELLEDLKEKTNSPSIDKVIVDLIEKKTGYVNLEINKEVNSDFMTEDQHREIHNDWRMEEQYRQNNGN